MTITNLTTAIAAVTEEQIDRCHRLYDLNKNEVYYQVESESDSLVEYEVRYSKEHGFTCSCKAGQEAFRYCYKTGTCKHVVWSVAHAHQFRKDEVSEQGDLTALVNQGASRDIATELAYTTFPVECEQFTELVDLTLTAAHSLTWGMGPNGYTIPMR